MALAQMFAERMPDNRTRALHLDGGVFSRKFDSTHSPLTQRDPPRIPGKYSAIQQEWCHHRQEKIDNPEIEFFLHEPKNLWIMAPGAIPIQALSMDQCLQTFNFKDFLRGGFNLHWFFSILE